MNVIRSSRKSTSRTIGVGHYVSTVTNIAYHEDYADHEAFRVEYELVDDHGRKHTYSEVFHNDLSNERTEQFAKYIEAIGTKYDEDGLPCIIGLRESIVLKKRIGFYRPVIDERIVLSTDNIRDNA